MSKHKDIWEEYGVNDAYFAVSTFDKFRSSNLDDAAKAEFFEMGREHIDVVWNEFESAFGTQVRPTRALDYGCGVGRLLLPMAAKSGTAIGVDISTAMLDETRRNADGQDLNNIVLQTADEFMADDDARYDLVHSYIVLQHINPALGYQIIEKLIERLEPGGFGMLHTTFKDQSGAFKQLRFKIYRDVPGVHRLMNKIRGIKEKLMPMYEYDREKVMALLQNHGCEVSSVTDTDHGFLGGMIFFRKR